MTKKREKVLVAMSGGVDSSVAAALLQKQGFEVGGVFMKIADIPRFKDSEKMAKKAAEVLGIPLVILDIRKEFKKRIISSFLKDYMLGLTPNPCVVCNKEIKFKFLLDKALSLGVDYIATGHYARVLKRKNKICLLRAKDKEKDQSYFLWQLGQRELKLVLFPLGSYFKGEVKRLAKRFKLPSFGFSESQEICFVDKDIDDFLNGYFKVKPGKIINTKGEIIGKHQGLWLYTIGQRKRIGLSGGPFYVLSKDLEKNILIITKDKKDLLRKELVAREVNWILGKEPKLPMKVMVKIRYRHNLSIAKIEKKSNKEYRIIFNRLQRAVTSGQSVVFYAGREILGGGVIV